MVILMQEVSSHTEEDTVLWLPPGRNFQNDNVSSEMEMSAKEMKATPP